MSVAFNPDMHQPSSLERHDLKWNQMRPCHTQFWAVSLSSSRFRTW